MDQDGSTAYVTLCSYMSITVNTPVIYGRWFLTNQFINVQYRKWADLHPSDSLNKKHWLWINWELVTQVMDLLCPSLIFLLLAFHVETKGMSRLTGLESDQYESTKNIPGQVPSQSSWRAGDPLIHFVTADHSSFCYFVWW